MNRLAQLFEVDAAAKAFRASEQPLKTLADLPHDYRLVTRVEDARALAAELEKAPLVGFDTETTSVDAKRARLVGMSFSSH